MTRIALATAALLATLTLTACDQAQKDQPAAPAAEQAAPATAPAAETAAPAAEQAAPAAETAAPATDTAAPAAEVIPEPVLDTPKEGTVQN